MQMTWLTFHKVLSIFDWIIPLFRLRHLTHKGPCEQNIWRRTPWARYTDCIQGVDDLLNVWRNSVNIWLNYLPFPILAFCTVKQPCEQNIWRTTWARIMISGILFGTWCRWVWDDFSRLMTKPTKWLCEQRRLRSAWTSAQSDQSFRCPHEESLSP